MRRVLRTSRPSLGTSGPRAAKVILAALLAFIVVALLIDTLYLPTTNLPILYVIPILIAVLFLPPGYVRIVAVVAFIGDTFDLAMDVRPWERAVGTGTVVGIVCLLAVLLAEQRQKTQMQTAAANEAREKLQRFMGMVAHDLRSPLTVLSGTAQVVLGRSWIESVPARDRQSLEKMVIVTHKMARLIGDLADASAMGAGHFVVNASRTDLMKILSSVVSQEQATTSAHHLALAGPAHVEGTWDRGRIEQVFTNLVSNAIKHTPGGDVRVTARVSDHQVIVDVSDQGPGLTQEQLSLLFEPFGRIDRTHPGYGLGLYISREIVLAHQGRIWVESTPGVGSHFYVALPVSESTRTSIAPRHSTGHSAHTA
jgi:signal transduction histidine kinase